MLVDPILRKTTQEQKSRFMESIREISPSFKWVDRLPLRLGCGIYITDTFTLGQRDVVGKLRKEYGEDSLLLTHKEAKVNEDFNYPMRPYGVCDNQQQIIDAFPELDDPRRHFYIALTKIQKETEPAQDGWRWEKWGPYIGDKTPQADYIYDEPEIDSVYCYHVYELLDFNFVYGHQFEAMTKVKQWINDTVVFP